MELLLHICCGPCAARPVRELLGRDVRLKALWYNPNIHPMPEYDKRLSALRELASKWALDVEYIDHYGEREFDEAISVHDGIRCEVCYRMRLDMTASVAAKEGYEAFTTSLLVSPYQKHDLIAQMGREAAEHHGVRFYYEDFRPMYREGATLSRELGLYRQKYCGCKYSLQERGPLKEKSAA